MGEQKELAGNPFAVAARVQRTSESRAALTQSILAVAHEQRTANLIALLALARQTPGDGARRYGEELLAEIRVRVGQDVEPEGEVAS